MNDNFYCVEKLTLSYSCKSCFKLYMPIDILHHLRIQNRDRILKLVPSFLVKFDGKPKSQAYQD